MAQSNILLHEDPRAVQPDCLATLKELTLHGYVPDAGAAELAGSILLRHPSGPDLVLRENGSLDLPKGQSPKPSAVPPVGSPWRAWRIGFLAFLALAVYTFVSLALVSTIISY